MREIAVAVDLRPEFGPARNQGSRPTCLAFCASDAHAGLRSGWVPLSCEYAFYQAQRRAGRPPSAGAVLSAMLDALRENGQPYENGWPYLEVSPTHAGWAPPAAVGPIFGRAGENFNPFLDQVIHELDKGQPVMILLTLSHAFYVPDAQGVVHPAAGEAPEVERRHAVVGVGHGMIDRHRAFLVRNSWGRKWGDAGYGWLTEPFLGPRIFAAAKLTEEVDVPACSVAA